MSKKSGMIMFAALAVLALAVFAAVKYGGGETLSQIEECELMPVTDLEGNSFSSFSELRAAAGSAYDSASDADLLEAGYVMKDGKIWTCYDEAVFQ